MTKFVYSMSHPWKVVEKKLLDDKSLRFAEHLTKIILLPKHSAINHWIKDLYSYCHWMNKITIKPNNKRISIKQMDDYFFGSCNDSISFNNWCNTIREEFNIKEDNINDEEKFNNKVLPFIKQLETQLYSKQNFTINDMNQLVNTYLL